MHRGVVRMNHRLDGWKAIAAHLKRDERTARRWADSRAMPINRIPGGGSVFALTAELDAWLESAPPERGFTSSTAETPSAAEAAVEPIVEPFARRWPRGRRAWMAAGAALAAGALIVMAPAAMNSAPAKAALPASAQASSYYLAGLHALNSRTPAGLRQAIESFDATLNLEPDFAPAQVGLAESYNLIREFGAMPDSEAYPKAETAARAAIALDPENAGAHRALAFVLFNFRHDGPGAEAEFARSLQLDPTAARTHHWWATTLLAMGRAGEAMRAIDRARELDPEATAIQTDRAVILARLGDIGAARAELARLAALDPSTPGPVRVGAHLALVARDGAAFVALERQAARLRNDATEQAIADAAARGLATNGWNGMIDSVDREVERLNAEGLASDFQRAVVAAARGDTRRTAMLIRAMIASHAPEAMTVLGESAFADTLRADPALADSVRSAMGIGAGSNRTS